nr:MAG: hypothetical protein [Bacteriophage sp.]
MTLFSCRKYNNFILIQEIFDKFWCECNGDKAALTAAAQADAQRLAQEKANAMECDCVEPTKTWSAYASGSFNGQCLSISVSYDNPCGKSISASFDVYYTRSEPFGDVEYFSTTKTVIIPSGSGTVSGGSDCVSNATSMYVSNPSQGGGC